jgi:hypothetical protein
VSNLYELCYCPNLARQNHRVPTFLPHSLSSTAASPCLTLTVEWGILGPLQSHLTLGLYPFV